MGLFGRKRRGPHPHQEWQEMVHEAHETLQLAASWRTLINEASDCPIMLQPGEEALLVLHGASLVETRRTPVTYRGGGIGASTSLGGGLRMGIYNHQSIPSGGEEQQTVVDRGLFVVTNVRGVFAGTKQVREFDWSKLLSIQFGALSRKALVIYLPVSNRQKVSGIGGDWDTMAEIPVYIQLAVGLATEGEQQLLTRLRSELAQLYAGEPPQTT